MRDYLNTTDAPSSYCGIIQTIYKEFMKLTPTTEEGRNFVESLLQKWSEQVTNNFMPLLYIGGIENKDNYLKFKESDPTIYEFGILISNLIKTGDYNLLLNLCAEEHYKNTNVYPEWLETELRGTSEQCKNHILQNELEGINSELYENIKNDLIQSGELTIDESSLMYTKAINNIKNYILDNSKVDTFEGQKLLDENIQEIFESNTPVLKLKEFKTNAQQVAPHDAKLMDILKFVNKNIKNSPSLNVLLNIAKEEHLQNTGRANEPDSDETIKALKDYWNAGDSEIEQGIKNGVFNNLKSNLLMNLKSDLIPDSNETKILNIPEQAPMDKLLESLQDLEVFSPIGVLYDDEEKNQKYAFVEDDVYQIDVVDNSIIYNSVDIKSISHIPESLLRFTQAFKELSYNPKTQEFKPALSKWDFNIQINNEGKVFLYKSDEIAKTASMTEIDLSDLRNLFVETLELFKQTNISETEIKNLERDADNFVIVALNYNKLILFEDLIQLQSLFENTYAIIPSDNLFENDNQISKPQIISGTNDKVSKTYKSFQELVNDINKNIGLKSEKSVNHLFSNNLNQEFKKNYERQLKIGSLNEQQKQLNQEIQSKNNLLKLAEPESPAQQKLQKELDKLNSDLDENLNQLNYYVNDFDILKNE